MNKFYTLPNETRLLAKSITRVGLNYKYTPDENRAHKGTYKIAGVEVNSIDNCTDILPCDSPHEAKLLLKRIAQELETIHRDRP